MYVLLTQRNVLDAHLLRFNHHLRLFPRSHTQNPLVLSLHLPSVTLDYRNLLNQSQRVRRRSRLLHLDLLPMNLVLLVAVGLVQRPLGLHSLS